MSGLNAVVIGCGIAGIATAYYLSKKSGFDQIVLIDRGQPMAFTSAQSGENYRNWWPHNTMTKFTDLSISLMEELARSSGNTFNMTRRGYVLATRRAEIDDLVETLHEGYATAGDAEKLIRFHRPGASDCYVPPVSADWEAAPDGVDVIQDPELIRSVFPNYDSDLRSILHIRRAGDVSGQGLGQLMLDAGRAANVKRVSGLVTGVERADIGFKVTVRSQGSDETVSGDIIVNAAGPFLQHVGQLIGYDLPVRNVRQQKIAFEDKLGAIPRDMPFSIDLDGQTIDWEDEDRELLLDDPENAWLAQPMPGSIHCKAEGAEHGKWVKLGWAYTTDPSEPEWEPELDMRFPEIVLRGAARLNPALKEYYGRLPRQMSHYGGYYTMTEENWPLIGRAGPEGSFVVGALSGFGTMAACASGYLVAEMMTGGDVPDWAGNLSLDRYSDASLIAELKELAVKSVL